MAPRDASPVPSPKAHASEETISLQVQEFLQAWEFRVMKSSLGKKWKREQVVASALEILQINGVPFEQEEIDMMARMDEGMLCPLVADKIPPELYDYFEVLTQQLHIMLETATVIRTAVDESGGNLAKVMEESSETDRVLQVVLKKAVIQASKEAAQLQRCSKTWGDSMDKRLDRLSRAAEYAELAGQQLIALESKLHHFVEETKAKSKTALMGFAHGNDRSTLKSVWAAWLGETYANKETREIRAKYEKELQEAEAELYSFQSKQLAGVRQMLMSRIRESDRGLVDFCISTWYDVVKQIKKEGDTLAELQKLQDRMSSFKADAKDKQMKVFGRLVDDREQAVVVLAMSSWVSFHQEYQKDKEHEEAVKKAERALNEHLKGKKDETTKLLDRMGAATDTGLMGHVFNAWLRSMEEDKKARKLQEEMAQTDVRLKEMLSRSKGNAFGVQHRTNEQMNENLLLRVLAAWITEYKVGRVEKYYDKKIIGKKAQLNKVHTLFKTFANQLEEGLKTSDGDTSTRSNTRRTRGQLSKSDGTVSLPDIHARAPRVA